MSQISATPTPFRTCQAISDLRHVVEAVPPEVWHRMPRIRPETSGAAPGFVAAVWQVIRRGGRVDDPGALGLHAVLTRAASSPQPDAEAFRAATALLLLDALQGGRGPDPAWLFWRAFAPDYTAAPDVVRAAILNAHMRLSVTGPSLNPAPDPAALVTRPAASVLAPLAELASATTATARARIVAADASVTAAEAVALRAEIDRTLDREGGLIPDDEDWLPLPGIEAASLAPERPGFVGATAMLLIAAIRRGDLVGWFDQRWEAVGPAYLALPPRPRTAILAGIRHLYESDPTFLEAADLVYDPDGRPGDGPPRGVLIPVT